MPCGKSCGIFDVSHMTVVDVMGPDATAFLRRLLANDIGKLREPGQGLYSCMLNDAGGVVDDLIAYWTGDDRYPARRECRHPGPGPGLARARRGPGRRRAAAPGRPADAGRPGPGGARAGGAPVAGRRRARRHWR